MIVPRLYAALLHLLPRRFRNRFGREMTDVFAELHREAGTRALAREVPPLLALAARERLAGCRAALRARRMRPYSAAVAAASPAPAAPRVQHPSRDPRMLDPLRQDVRYALRSLLRAPGFAVVAVLTLALGIGANTAIFSVVHGVLLQPLGLPGETQLVAIGEGRTDGPLTTLNATSPGSFGDIASQTTSLAGVAAFTGVGLTVTGRGEPETLQGVSFAGELFAVLGTRPMLGRVPVAEEQVEGANPVIVLSYPTWRRMFGNDRTVIGKTITGNGTARTIVGVMPEGFRFPSGSAEFWTPQRWSPAFRVNRDQYYLTLVGRLAPGTSIERARADLVTVSGRLARDYATYNTNLRLNAVPLRDMVVSNVRTRLYILMGAVAFVLLITCANLGNLLLARGVMRRREIAVRQALGANRTRLARQLMTESLVLSLVGGAVGLLVGKLFMAMLLAQQTLVLPRRDEIGLHPAVLLFAFGVSIVAGLAFGVIPALQLSGGRSSDALREGSRGSGGQQWARTALVVSELALSLMLLAGAGLLLRSFAMLTRVDPGFRSERLLTFGITLRRQTPTTLTEMSDRLAALPGVRTVAAVSQLPATGRGGGAWFNILERPTPPNQTPPGEIYRVITPPYFETIGLPLLRGRLLTRDDRLDGMHAVVVNAALAKKYWPDGDPIGKEIYLGAPDNRLFDHGTIVGIVGDTKDGGLDADALPIVYGTNGLMPWWSSYSFVIRTSGDPTQLAAAVRREMRAIDPALAIQNLQSMDAVLRDQVAPARWSMTLLGVFAGIAVTMAALGVFGVLSFLVTQRTKELGIRLALGAEPGRLRRMVLAQGLGLAALGIAIGVGGALALTRLMASLLFGVTPSDPATFVAVSLLLITIAAVASYIPARRATQVDPLTALRSD
jgi:putative ABC transport system permease protein